MATFLERLRLAFTVNSDFYEEIISDPKTQAHSLWVVAIFAMAASFGTFGRAGGTAVNISLFVTLFSWYIWAFTTYYLGTRFFAETDTPKDKKTIMRVMGFASAPGILRIFGLIPHLSGLLFIVSSLWMLYASATGLKKALNYSSMSRAVGLTLASYILSLVVQAILMVMLFQLLAVSGSK